MQEFLFMMMIARWLAVLRFYQKGINNLQNLDAFELMDDFKIKPNKKKRRMHGILSKNRGVLIR